MTNPLSNHDPGRVYHVRLSKAAHKKAQKKNRDGFQVLEFISFVWKAWNRFVMM